MNPVLIGVFFTSLLATPALSQTPADSTSTSPDTAAQHPGGFIDRNGNGVDDRKEGKGMRRGKDRFVDNDGDGICDGRERGLGFRGGRGDGAGKGRQSRGGRK